ncbi:hypothetical protein IIA79_00925 [bacterium]|nr:hypothetical protein [bacterium]
MRKTEVLRLALIGLLLLLLQLAWYLAFPQWRGAVDLYVPFLLLLTAGRGPFLGGAFAVLGGLVMDAYSTTFITFHIFYYLLPVAVGSLLRSRMLVEFPHLGALTVALLLFSKVVAQLLAAIAFGWVDSWLYLFRVNYWPLLVMFLLTYLGWRFIVGVVLPGAGVKRVAY